MRRAYAIMRARFKKREANMIQRITRGACLAACLAAPAFAGDTQTRPVCAEKGETCEAQPATASAPAQAATEASAQSDPAPKPQAESKSDSKDLLTRGIDKVKGKALEWRNIFAR